MNTINGDDIIWHNGEVGGFTSLTAMNTTTHSAIEVMTNTANGNYQNCVLSLLTDKDCAPIAQEYPVADAQMQKMVGIYTFQSGDVPSVEIRQQKDFLMAVIEGQNLRLYATGENQFSVSSSALGTLVFQTDAQGAFNQLTLTLDNVSNVAMKN